MNTWSCPRCTLSNSQSICEACGLVRQNAQLPIVVAHTVPQNDPPPPKYTPRPLSEFLDEVQEDECILDVSVSNGHGGRYGLTRIAPGDEIKEQLLRIIQHGPVLREDGSIQGASPSYIESMANAGAAGGEAEARQSQGQSFLRLNQGQSRRQTTTQREDGGGVRVNPTTTDGPIYDNAADFETWAETPTVSSPDTLLPTVVERRAEHNKNETMSFETVAVAAKLRNMARLGGERVREMDHFVESKIETEIVELEDGQKQKNSVSARRLVEREARRTLLANGQTYLLANTSSKQQQQLATKYIDIFAFVLDRVLAILGCPENTRLTSIKIYYLATIRADEFVCAKDDDDSMVYVNALAFHQADVCDIDTNSNYPTRVKPSMWPTILPYWCHRLRELCGSHRSGLYSSEVRSRLADHLFDLCGEAPGFELWLSNSTRVDGTLSNHTFPPIDDSDLLLPPVDDVVTAE